MSALPAPTPASPTSTNSTYNWSTHEFVVPQKRISSMEDLRNFTRSRTHDQLMGFIRCLNDTVIRVPTTSECFMSEVSFNRSNLHLSEHAFLRQRRVF